MTKSPRLTKSLPANICVGAVTVGAFVWLFFWTAGRFDWIRGWAYIGLFTCGQSASSLYIWRRSGRPHIAGRT